MDWIRLAAGLETAAVVMGTAGDEVMEMAEMFLACNSLLKKDGSVLVGFAAATVDEGTVMSVALDGVGTRLVITDGNDDDTGVRSTCCCWA